METENFTEWRLKTSLNGVPHYFKCEKLFNNTTIGTIKYLTQFDEFHRSLDASTVLELFKTINKVSRL